MGGFHDHPDELLDVAVGDGGALPVADFGGHLHGFGEFGDAGDEGASLFFVGAGRVEEDFPAAGHEGGLVRELVLEERLADHGESRSVVDAVLGGEHVADDVDAAVEGLLEGEDAVDGEEGGAHEALVELDGSVGLEELRANREELLDNAQPEVVEHRDNLGSDVAVDAVDERVVDTVLDLAQREGHRVRGIEQGEHRVRPGTTGGELLLSRAARNDEPRVPLTSRGRKGHDRTEGERLLGERVLAENLVPCVVRRVKGSCGANELRRVADRAAANGKNQIRIFGADNCHNFHQTVVFGIRADTAFPCHLTFQLIKNGLDVGAAAVLVDGAPTKRADDLGTSGHELVQVLLHGVLAEEDLGCVCPKPLRHRKVNSLHCKMLALKFE